MVIHGDDTFGRYCAFFTYQRENHNAPPEYQGEISLVHCAHADNPDPYEGNCTRVKCPLLKALNEMENVHVDSN